MIAIPSSDSGREHTAIDHPNAAKCRAALDNQAAACLAGNDQTSSRLPAFSLFVPGSSPDNRDHRTNSKQSVAVVLQADPQAGGSNDNRNRAPCNTIGQPNQIARPIPVPIEAIAAASPSLKSPANMPSAPKVNSVNSVSVVALAFAYY